MYQVQSVNDATCDDMIRFLRFYEDTALFLLGNLEVHGFRLTEASYSGNYKVIRNDSGDVVAVFCLTRCGNLQIQSEVMEQVFDLILQACRQESLPICGVIGEWNVAFRLWNYLKAKHVIQRETFVSKEILYRVDISKETREQQSNVRLLTPEDYEEWLPLRLAYIEEMHIPNPIEERLMRQEFTRKAENKICWGLFGEGKLISIADLNAKALDLGQVGGVFTLATYRRRGFSRTVMQQLFRDAKLIHGIRKLIIFTGEDNTAARRVYEGLGVNSFGHYALLFGK